MMNRNSRSTWKSDDDLALMKTLLNRADTLHDHYLQSSPAKHFWDIIIKDLAEIEKIDKNARQCRDRFNILYSKGIRNKISAKPINSENEKVLERVVSIFHLDEKGQIVVKEDSKVNTPQPLPRRYFRNATNSISSTSGSYYEQLNHPLESKEAIQANIELNQGNTENSISNVDVNSMPNCSPIAQSLITANEIYGLLNHISRQIFELNGKINNLENAFNKFQNLILHQNIPTTQTQAHHAMDSSIQTDGRSASKIPTATTFALFPEPGSPYVANSMRNIRNSSVSQLHSPPLKETYTQFPYTWGLYTKAAPNDQQQPQSKPEKDAIRDQNNAVLPESYKNTSKKKKSHPNSVPP